VGVVTLTELLDLLEDAGEGVFGLGDGTFRVILALQLQTLVMLLKFFPVEVGEASTLRHRKDWNLTRSVDAVQATFQGHA
jgi:hypothetical protein